MAVSFQMRHNNSSGNRLTSVTDLMPGFSLSPQADGDRNGAIHSAGTSYGSSPKDSNVSPVSQIVSGKRDKKRDLSILIPEGQTLKGDVRRVANGTGNSNTAQNKQQGSRSSLRTLATASGCRPRASRLCAPHI